VNFEWDEEKTEENIGKHGFDFADAHEVFNGPLLEALDTRADYGEDRIVGIGFLKTTIVVMVYTERTDHTIRIISLRKALKHERIEFERFLADELDADQ